jgi:hypothetical protein
MPSPPPATPAPKRRLTVLNNAGAEPGEDASTPRRPWQWVGFGVLAIVTAWIPLAGLAGLAASRLAEGAVVSAVAGAEAPAGLGAGIGIAAAYVAALGLGAALGGFLVGRWGTSRVGTREAALAGLGASAVATVVTWVAFGPSPGAVLVAAVATPLAALGGRFGVRARRA